MIDGDVKGQDIILRTLNYSISASFDDISVSWAPVPERPNCLVWDFYCLQTLFRKQNDLKTNQSSVWEVLRRNEQLLTEMNSSQASSNESLSRINTFVQENRRMILSHSRQLQTEGVLVDMLVNKSTLWNLASQHLASVVSTTQLELVNKQFGFINTVAVHLTVQNLTFSIPIVPHDGQWCVLLSQCRSYSPQSQDTLLKCCIN